MALRIDIFEGSTKYAGVFYVFSTKTPFEKVF